ncbi:MAG TPA: class I SAM-dependent methyltransferase [Terriglobales bacterium]|nr:class I SAM-dependent methyltransferase [Terriglobales bacterium]
MLDLLPASRPLTVLDFGCGASHLYEYIVGLQLSGIQYVGLDISPKFIQLCRSKFPHNTYICADILQTPEAIPEVDCVVMNGVFTEKCSLSAAQMLAFIQQTLVAAFRKARYGIAFNVMSAHVDWQRDDLFHLPFDLNAEFLTRHLSRHFNVRNDYGLYEYTTYVFRQKRD